MAKAACDLFQPAEMRPYECTSCGYTNLAHWTGVTCDDLLLDGGARALTLYRDSTAATAYFADIVTGDALVARSRS
jgi:hypothetical protein